MVTKDGNKSISLVVSIELLLQASVFKVTFIKQSLEGDGGVVGTEHLRGQPLHLGVQVFIECRSLGKADKLLTFA